MFGHPGTPHEGTWVSLEPEWKVTAPFGITEIWVQHKDNEGVVARRHRLQPKHSAVVGIAAGAVPNRPDVSMLCQTRRCRGISIGRYSTPDC
jgi:hypothetical protein